MDLYYEERGDFLDEDPLPFVPMKHVETVFDTKPLLSALRYVVNEGRKHALEGHDDHFVEVARICQAALVWWKYDREGEFDKAQTWLARIPRT